MPENYFENYLEKLQVEAIIAGISLNEYWDLTIAEILLYFEAYKEKRKIKLMDNYNQAQLIGMAFAANNPWCEGKVKVPPIYELYPTIFNNPQKEIQQQDWQTAKAHLMKFVELHNKKEVKAN